MASICLLGCVKKKLTCKARARELYTSVLFTLSLRYAERVLKPDRTFILSARYGLLELDKEIEPYDETLSSLSATKRRAWAEGVIAQLCEVADLEADDFTVLAGERYIEFLRPHLRHLHEPLHGMPIGKRIAWLKKQVGEL
jgi:hypothetical protein